MRRFLLLILYADLVGCLVYQLIYTFTTTNFYGLAVGIFSFFNFFLPTVAAVVIFLLSRKKITRPDPSWAVASQAIFLSIVYCTGLFICMILEAWSIEFIEIESLFTDEYYEYMLVAISQAITIPVTDIILTRRHDCVRIIKKKNREVRSKK